MDVFLDLMHKLSDPDQIVAHGGLYLLLFIIFAETGILVGFFLPGDPILFIAGIIISNMTLDPNAQIPTLLYWISLISLAAVLGNFLGYLCGYYFGKRILKVRDGWLFKKKYIHKAQQFYQRQGGGAIILARFLPVIRTFAPVVAGIVGMDLKKFVFYNITGGLFWVVSLMTLGYVLGENKWVQNNLELVILGIVVLATAPVILKAMTGNNDERSAIRIEKKQEG